MPERPEQHSETLAELTPEQRERIERLRQQLLDSFNQTPFMAHLGARLTEVDDRQVRAELQMQPFLVGNVFKQVLHGGAIAAILDNVAGCAAVTAIYARLRGQPGSEKLKRISQLGTIDLRVDFLKPGRGERFVAIGRVVRAGSKIVATQMELRNQDDDLIATGNAVFYY